MIHLQPSRRGRIPLRRLDPADLHLLQLEVSKVGLNGRVGLKWVPVLDGDTPVLLQD